MHIVIINLNCYQKESAMSNLHQKSDGNWAYRQAYHSNWEVITDEFVQESFNKHFAGQEFDTEKADAAVGLEMQKMVVNPETPRTVSKLLQKLQ